VAVDDVLLAAAAEGFAVENPHGKPLMPRTAIWL
jgi:hypothetical protein